MSDIQYARALNAVRRISNIYDAAAGRALTASQTADYRSQAAVLTDAIDQLGGNAAFIQYAEHAASGGPRAKEAAADLERMLTIQDYEQKYPAAQAIRRGAASLGGGLSRTYGSGNDSVPLFELFQRAIEGGSGAYESSVSSEWFEGRALQSAGGSAFVSTMADRVYVYERTLNPLWVTSTVLGRETGAPLVIPRLTADAAIGGTATAEAAGITEADPTISQVTLTPAKRGGITNFSYELFEDNTIGIEGLVAEALARPIALGFGTAFTTGAAGIVTLAGTAGTAAGTTSGASSWTFFGPPDLSTTFYSVAAAYRASGAWMVSPDALSKITSFRDSQNMPIFQPGWGGQPATLMGRPVYENPAMAAVASASKSVMFGQLDRYVIARVNPLRVEVSNEYKWSTDQISCRVLLRADGALVDTDAVKLLISANT